MENGGLRPGAGRKKGSLNKETIQREAMRKALLDEIFEHKHELAAALVKKGMSGDVPALKEIHDRSLGRVRDQVDITSGGERINAITYLPPSNGNADGKANT